MKAAVVHSFDRPLTIEDVPTPKPGSEQVLVRIEASGLCHTDIHAARGEWPVKPALPFILGHEGVGIVSELGPGNSHGVAVGDRVAIPWLGYACGDCRYCNSGRETLCHDQQNTGYSIFETVLGGLSIEGSIVGTHHDLEEVFALHQRGLTRVISEERALDDVNDAVESVLDGSAHTPRLVFRLASTTSNSNGAPHAAVTA
jgi:D-arabinose 1-dehydrogenase-like Zn-dependent alcohol dehydrogenase